MSQRLTIFISSTVRDFGPVRRDLGDWLRERGLEVRLSEDPEFPVVPAVHSQDACLRAIDGCHLYVLLIGWRYGGLYNKTTQSITWREYDEARKLGIPTIVFVLNDVVDEAIREAEAGRVLGKIDPGIVRFVDTVRKQPRDNWVHLEWDGSCAYLRQCLDARMNALFVAYQRPHMELERRALRFENYAQARAALDDVALDAFEKPRLVVDRMLYTAVEFREALFGFAQERYKLVVHERHGGELRVFARAQHPAIPIRNRAFRVGLGFIGLAAQSSTGLSVAANVEHEPGWLSEYPTDVENYRSAVSVAIPARSSATPAGVLTITSSRIDHFRDLDQPEVLTAQSLARIISLTGALDKWLTPVPAAPR